MKTTIETKKATNKGGKVATGETLVSVKELTPAQIAYRNKLQETKQAFENLKTSIAEELGTKTVTLPNGKEKIVSPSKALISAKASILHLQSLETRSLTESKRLLGALSKVDKMSASKVFDYINKILLGTIGGKDAETIQNVAFEVLGSKVIPTFTQFVEYLPIKFAYSESDGFNALANMNKAKQLALKIERQNKATAKK